MRIFSNILSNALKYSDGDPEITLNDSGEIIFTNTATGLDEIQVGKIFDRFYTVENARTSTGLGLSIARSLAERMGGKISASYGKKNCRLSLISGQKTLGNLTHEPINHCCNEIKTEPKPLVIQGTSALIMY